MEKQLSSLSEDLVEIGRLREDDDVTAMLERLVGRATRTIPGCDHVVVTMLTVDNKLETVAGGEAASLTHAITDLQPWHGPIREAVLYREPRRVDDARTEDRWEGLPQRMAQAGFRSLLALPVPTQRHPRVGFTLLARSPHQFGDHVLDLAFLFALQGGTAVDNAALYGDARQLIDHLQQALGTREAIGRAKGILMQRLSCDDDTALRILRRVSQHFNVKVRDLAARVNAAQQDGELDAVLAQWSAEEPA